MVRTRACVVTCVGGRQGRCVTHRAVMLKRRLEGHTRADWRLCTPSSCPFRIPRRSRDMAARRSRSPSRPGTAERRPWRRRAAGPRGRARVRIAARVPARRRPGRWSAGPAISSRTRRSASGAVAVAEQADGDVRRGQSLRAHRTWLAGEQPRTGESTSSSPQCEPLTKAPLEIVGLRRLRAVDADLRGALCTCLDRARAWCRGGRVRGEALDVAHLIADADKPAPPRRRRGVLLSVDFEPELNPVPGGEPSQRAAQVAQARDAGRFLGRQTARPRPDEG
jgi:hypothetical protein